MLKACTSRCVEVMRVEIRGSRRHEERAQWGFALAFPVFIHSFGLLLMYSILFTQVPMLSRPTSTTSPSLSHNGGFLPDPTPCGLITNQLFSESKQALGSTYVPVNIKSPGSRVVPWLRKLIVFATPKTMSFVLLSWTILPLTLVEILRA